MPKKTHGRSKHHKSHSSEEGFISSEIQKNMSRNEKLVMGLLVGGILVFLVISIVVLYSRSRQVDQPPTATDQERKIAITPYPTIPPIENMMVMINPRRFNPDTATIPRGGYVQFLNVGTTTITIEGANAASSILNIGSIAPSEDSVITFTQPGTYIYRNKDNPQQVGRVVVE